MTPQTPRLPWRQRLSLQPDLSRLLVGRALQFLLDPLKKLLRLLLIPEPAVTIGEPDHQLTARMRSHAVELCGLHLIRLLKIRETFFDQRLRHVGARDVVRGSEQPRATRNSYAQIVRLERHRRIHFSQAALPHFATVLHVA